MSMSESQMIDELEDDESLKVVPNESLIKPTVKKERKSRSKSITTTNNNNSTIPSITSTSSIKPKSRSNSIKPVEKARPSITSTTTTTSIDKSNSKNDKNNNENNNNNLKKRKVLEKKSVWVCPEIDENGEPIISISAVVDQELIHKSPPTLNSNNSNKNNNKNNNSNNNNNQIASTSALRSRSISPLASSIELPLSLHMSIKNEIHSSSPLHKQKVQSTSRVQSPIKQINNKVDLGLFDGVITPVQDEMFQDDPDLTLVDAEEREVENLPSNSTASKTQNSPFIPSKVSSNSSSTPQTSLPKNPSPSKRQPFMNVQSSNQPIHTPVAKSNPQITRPNSNSTASTSKTNQSIIPNIPSYSNYKPATPKGRLISLTAEGISSAISELLNQQNSNTKSLEIQIDSLEQKLQSKDKINLNFSNLIKTLEKKLEVAENELEGMKGLNEVLNGRIDIFEEVRRGLLSDLEDKDKLIVELEEEKKYWKEKDKKKMVIKSEGVAVKSEVLDHKPSIIEETQFEETQIAETDEDEE